MAESRMFPLGSVLMPGMLLPLRVFEPRYRQMLVECLAGDGTFGVVLIERGSEVGGGDVRVDVGTMADIMRAEELPDGQWAVMAVGRHRIRVERWLPDDPYPRAEVSEWPDDPTAPGGGVIAEVQAVLRRAAALASEAGMPAAPLDLELDEDPVTASYQAMAAGPLGPADRQRLLAAPTLPERWELLHSLLTDQVELLTAYLDPGA